MLVCLWRRGCPSNKHFLGRENRSRGRSKQVIYCGAYGATVSPVVSTMSKNARSPPGGAYPLAMGSSSQDRLQIVSSSAWKLCTNAWFFSLAQHACKQCFRKSLNTRHFVFPFSPPNRHSCPEFSSDRDLRSRSSRIDHLEALRIPSPASDHHV